MKSNIMADIFIHHDPIIEITHENDDEHDQGRVHDKNYATNTHVIKPNTNTSSNIDRNYSKHSNHISDR